MRCNFFVYFYLIFQVRTSSNTFQVGEHGVSNFSIIILNSLNVSLNVLNVSLNVLNVSLNVLNVSLNVCLESSVRYPVYCLEFLLFLETLTSKLS